MGATQTMYEQQRTLKIQTITRSNLHHFPTSKYDLKIKPRNTHKKKIV